MSNKRHAIVVGLSAGLSMGLGSLVGLAIFGTSSAGLAVGIVLGTTVALFFTKKQS